MSCHAMPYRTVQYILLRLRTIYTNDLYEKEDYQAIGAELT